MGKSVKIIIVSLYTKYKDFILYGLIGGLSAGLDFGVYSLLCLLGMNYQIANVISINCGIFCSFILNRHYNFKTKDKIAKRFLSFYIIGLFGLALTWLLLHFMVSMKGINKLIAKLITIFIVAIIQFFLNKFITFKKTEKA